MNILYIDHYAGSDSMGMEFRPYYLAKEWAKEGINTYILAADFSHLRKENPIVLKDLEEKKIDGEKFIFLKTGSYFGNSIKRIKSMFLFIFKGLYYTNKIVSLVKPDVVICSSTYPLDTYIGQRIKKKTNALLIHEIHDLWPLTPMELGGYSKNHPFIQVMQKAEISAYENSDIIVSVLPNNTPYVKSLGINKEVINIPNGLLDSTIEEEGYSNKKVSELVNKLHSEGKKVIAYAGGISVSNAMRDFMLAMNELKNKEDIAAVIIGDGILKDELIKYKEEKNMKNVYFIDKINKSEVVPTLSLMDALYIGSQKSKLYQYGVSANKIFDYMLSGVPIVNAFDTEHSPLNYADCTIIAKATDYKEISKAIEKALNLSEEEKVQIREKSISYIKNNHRYSYLAKQFKNLFYK